MRLEFQNTESGISTLTPPEPKPKFQSLPLILRTPFQNSKPNYSKASRGLSVLLQVNRIFTVTLISPSLSLRQCSDHYTFRAGRNLPDKEFRYLRTVIVTAAVYWRFSSDLISPPFNVPALGRSQPLYISFRFGRDLCFC